MTTKNFKKDDINMGLMTLIATILMFIATLMFNFATNNSSEHSALTKLLVKEIEWTHTVNELAIKPNTNKIEKNVLRVEDHEGRIIYLEGVIGKK